MEVRASFSRRHLLSAARSLGAGRARLRDHRSPFAGGSQTVSFWHLLGGSDGDHLTEILVDIVRRARRQRRRELILPWGEPYYTKLALAGASAGRRPTSPSSTPRGCPRSRRPDYSRSSRSSCSRATASQAAASSTSRGRRPVGGELVRHPVRHPSVRPLLQHRDLPRRPGLLDADGKLKPTQRARRAAGRLRRRSRTRPARPGWSSRCAACTPWRIFLTLYEQLGGPLILETAAPGSASTTPRRSRRSS